MKQKALFSINNNRIQIENIKVFKVKFFEWLLLNNKIQQYNLKDWEFCPPWMDSKKTWISKTTMLIPTDYDYNNMIYRKDFTKIKTSQDIITYGDFFEFIDYVVRKDRETKIEKILE